MKDLETKRILEELKSFNTIIRGFCESFDCKDLPCSECPIGEELCLAMGKQNVENKYVGSSGGRLNAMLNRFRWWLIGKLGG